MASNVGAKDERRRRIAERGSDRMALITGRINALPPTPPRHVQSLSGEAIDFNPINSDDDQNIPPRHHRPHSLSAFSGGAEDKRTLASTRLKHQGGFRYSSMDNFELKGEETDGAKMIVKQPPSVASTAHETQQQVKQPCSRSSRQKGTFFSSRELNLCILASETTRALSSLIIALLVVLYYMISSSALASRPLYILLLTDVTIVLARLHGGKAIVLEEAGEGDKLKDPGDGHSWGDAVKLLERGLVAYQAIRAVFIDCSIYLVIVVCATSFI